MRQEIAARRHRAREVVGELTPRERDVLQAIALGRSPADIADELELTLHTIRWYVQRLYRVCRCRNSVELARMAYRAGTVSVWGGRT